MRALAEVAPMETEAQLDTKWIEHMQKVIKAETDRLEHELRGYKNNLIKESIRVGNTISFLSVSTSTDSYRWVMRISDNTINKLAS